MLVNINSFRYLSSLVSRQRWINSPPSNSFHHFHQTHHDPNTFFPIQSKTLKPSKITLPWVAWETNWPRNRSSWTVSRRQQAQEWVSWLLDSWMTYLWKVRQIAPDNSVRGNVGGSLGVPQYQMHVELHLWWKLVPAEKVDGVGHVDVLHHNDVSEVTVDKHWAGNHCTCRYKNEESFVSFGGHLKRWLC